MPVGARMNGEDPPLARCGSPGPSPTTAASTAWIRAVTRDQSSAVRGASPSSHRERRGARMARRDDGEYREYLTEEQRSQPGCIAARMQMELHHGLLDHVRNRRID